MENENMNTEKSPVKNKALSNGIAFWVVVVLSAVV